MILLVRVSVIVLERQSDYSALGGNIWGYTPRNRSGVWNR